MAEFFGCTTDNISQHLKRIFAEGELIKELVTEKISATVCFIRNRICETQKKLLRLMGVSIQLPRDGVNEDGSDGVNDGANLLFEMICHYSGKRANELATLVGKSVAGGKWRGERNVPVVCTASQHRTPSSEN